MSDQNQGETRGRKRTGKRSNPDYVMLCGLIHKTSFRAMKVLLAEQDREISDLLQELVDRWIAEQYDD